MKTFKFVHYVNNYDPFRAKGNDVKGKLIRTSNGVVLEEIIQDFEDFLRGCGFHFDGNLQIVNDKDECGDEINEEV